MTEEVAKTPVRFALIEKSLSAEFRADFPNYPEGLVRGDPGGFVLTQKYADNVDSILQFPMRSEDVWVVTFPKCGTTWTQEMVWMITHDCDTEAGKELLFNRSPFIEFPYLGQVEIKQSGGEQGFDVSTLMTLEKIAAMSSPRILKTHLPLHLLPPGLVDTCKVVYVARNPKDVIVSYFHHHRLFTFQNYTSDIDKFAEYFMNDELYYSPFFGHILEGWAKRDHPNVLFLFYEDMKRNLRGEIEKVCKFLGKSLSEAQVQSLLNHLRFDNFAKNEAVNYNPAKKGGFANDSGNFIRKGKTGDWKNHFSAELDARLDQWIRKNLEGSDLKFKMELDSQD